MFYICALLIYVNLCNFVLHMCFTKSHKFMLLTKAEMVNFLMMSYKCRSVCII